jgi:hypothetical protein
MASIAVPADLRATSLRTDMWDRHHPINLIKMAMPKFSLLETENNA